ncbi:MAG: undecaprenyl phosphate translocase family protein, partial [Spirochaetaceae bacterium]
LLLLMGQYIPILSALEELKEALETGNWGEAVYLGYSVILPVGAGIVIGVVLVSNVLRFFLARFRRVTLGVLLGVLLGAVVGLWPFQEGAAPEAGDVFKGRTLSAEGAAEISKDEYPTEFFTPTAGQVAAAILLAAGGFGATYGISRFEG